MSTREGRNVDDNLIPLPPGSYLRVGYHRNAKSVLIIFEHPNSQSSVYLPLSTDSAQELSVMLADVVQMLNRKLDS